jgi:3-phenylpropionate/trans-cinnamate dioxygenase ferredoxin subunit
MPQEYVKVARLGELSPGQKKLVFVGEDRVLLVNLQGDYYAVEETCPHAQALLSRGQVYDNEVMCPVHGSAFNLKTGAAITPPAVDDLAVYSVRIEGEDILVAPPD